MFVLTMYRFGNREKHSYVQGVFTTLEKAQMAQEAEECYRGGKYLGNILDIEVDHLNEDAKTYYE